MLARPGPSYKPEDFRRGYSREQIVAHVGECLELYAELAGEHKIDAAIAPAVFGVIQVMCAAVEPTEEAMKAAATRAQIAGAGNGAAAKLGLIGQG